MMALGTESWIFFRTIRKYDLMRRSENIRISSVSCSFSVGMCAWFERVFVFLFLIQQVRTHQ